MLDTTINDAPDAVLKLALTVLEAIGPAGLVRQFTADELINFGAHVDATPAELGLAIRWLASKYSAPRETAVALGDLVHAIERARFRRAGGVAKRL